MDKWMSVIIDGKEFQFSKDQIEEFEKILRHFLAHPTQHTLILHFTPRGHNGQSN